MKCKVLFAAGCAAALLFSCSPKVTVLYDNDVHCAIDGYADMAALRSAAEADCKYVFTVSSGDFVQGGSIGAGTKGAYIVDIMNKVGYDFVTLGNHEFDYGMERQAGIVGELDAQVLDCNLFYLPENRRMYEPYAIVRCGSKRIAFVGVSTPYSFISSTPLYFQNEKGEYVYSLCVDNIYEVVQNAVDDARSRGADYVIVLSHLGDEVESVPVNSHALIANTRGIDVVLDGHSHSTVERRILKNSEGRDVLLTSTGSHFENVGRLTLERGRFRSELLSVSANSPKDSEVERFVDSLREDFEKAGKRIVCVSGRRLNADEDGVRIVRLGQQPLGHLIAEAYRCGTGSQIGSVSGGSIRTYLPQGAVSYNDLFSILPFGNEICTVELPGSVIADMIEFSVYGLPLEFGGYQQFSGLTFDVDFSVPSPVEVNANGEFTKFNGGGRRVSNIRVYDGQTGSWQPLEMQRLYKYAGTDYLLLNHGDGFRFTDNFDVRRTGMTDLQVLVNYITGNLQGVISAE